MEEINKRLNDILDQIFKIGAGQLSQLSSIDLMYLYSEIFLNYDILLTVEDIEDNCFGSLEQLCSCIYKKININKIEEVKE